MSDSQVEDRPASKSIRPLLMLVPFIKPYWGTLVLALIALLSASAAVLVMPLAVRDVIDQGFSADNAAQIDQYFYVLLIIAILIGVLGAARAYFVNWLGERVVADLREQVFGQVLTMDMKFFETTKVGEILSRLTTDTTLIQSISGVGLSIVLRSSIQFVGALILLAFTNFSLTALLVVLLFVVIAPIMVIGRWVRQLSRASQDRIADVSGYAGEILNAVQTVQMFTAERSEGVRFTQAVEASFKTAVKRIRFRALLTTVGMTGLFGAFIVGLWMGAKAVVAQEITGGELSQFVIYAVLVGASGGALIEFWGELQRAAGAMERLGQLLSLRPEILDPKAPKTLDAKNTGRITFDAVRFNYPSRPDTPALKNLNLTIEPGEQIALVGPSGAGKSTIFQLLLRMYDPQSGSVQIDGTDIRAFRLKDLRQFIGIVPQETVIFGVNALENIRFGRPEADPESVHRAAEAAHAETFIKALPEAFETDLGERGARLSGGQRQRIAIARAILKDPAVLLLDEATNALDVESERLVQAALDRLRSGRTTLVIAHRLATVMDADRIVVIADGEIKAVGQHQQLMATEPLYREMVTLQFGQTEPVAVET
ncbi:MAG: ATP-binding cassette domain-containing protein [Pseudomonadales bacterium]|nr:ATP-binding cassette domain-containing protein [Pseudomonadales bacterium]